MFVSADSIMFKSPQDINILLLFCIMNTYLDLHKYTLLIISTYCCVVVFCLPYWGKPLLSVEFILGVLLLFASLGSQGLFCNLKAHSVFLALCKTA